MDLITRNALAVMVEGDVPRYKTTKKGMEVLRCYKVLEELMPERGILPEDGVLL